MFFLSRINAKSVCSKHSLTAAVSVDDAKAKFNNDTKQDNVLAYYDNSSRLNSSSFAAQHFMETEQVAAGLSTFAKDYRCL